MHMSNSMVTKAERRLSFPTHSAGGDRHASLLLPMLIGGYNFFLFITLVGYYLQAQGL